MVSRLIKIHAPNVVVELLTLVISSHEVSGSFSGRIHVILTEAFPCFRQSLQANAKTVS
jgi:hypothetical protein